MTNMVINKLKSSYDEKRDSYLQTRGFRILRFWNNEINENLEGVLTATLDALSQHPSPASPTQ